MTDGDSVTINNLRDSANGTFVTLDDYLSLTTLGQSRLKKYDALCVIMCAFCPAWDTETTNLAGVHSIEVLVPSQKVVPKFSWVLISRGLNQYASQMLDVEQFVDEGTDRISQFEEEFSQPGKTLRAK